MIKPYSKKFHENIRTWLMNNYDAESDYLAYYKLEAPVKTWETYARHALVTFYVEMLKNNNRNLNIVNVFENWVSGLCNYLPSDYYYNVSAGDVLGDLLEETIKEREKYTETQAEGILTMSIFRELIMTFPEFEEYCKEKKF